VPDPPPQEDRDHRGQRGVQRGNRRDQIHAGLSGVDQRSGRLQVQRSPAASGDPLNELVGTGLASVHRAQQSAVGNSRRASVHAAWIGRATDDVGSGAARGRPRRRRRHDHVHDERGERQRDEPPDECRPVVSIVQPEHAGDHVRQDEKRHVDAADDHFPPRWLRHFQALLQPHCRDGAEEQPAVSVGLESPECRRPEQRRCPTAEVVEQQHKREREPIAQNPESLATTTDACGDQPSGDVEQQQFAIECQPVRQGPVGHHQCPGRDGHPPRKPEPTLAAGRADVVVGSRLSQRRSGRAFRTAQHPRRCRLHVPLEQSDPAISCY
jgi:hypothetical protein